MRHLNLPHNLRDVLRPRSPGLVADAPTTPPTASQTPPPPIDTHAAALSADVSRTASVSPAPAALTPPVVAAPLASGVLRPMGATQQLAMSRDQASEALEACQSVDELLATLGSLRTNLAQLPNRPAIAGLRQQTIEHVVEAALERFSAIDSVQARRKNLRAFVHAWRALDTLGCAANEHALAQTIGATLADGVKVAESWPTLTVHLEAASELHADLDTAADTPRPWMEAAVARATTLPGAQNEADITKFIARHASLGGAALPPFMEANWRLMALLTRPNYDLDECVEALQRIAAAMPEPTDVPSASRTELVANLQKWVKDAPDLLPPVSPYQLPPLTLVLSRLSKAAGVGLDIELGAPETDDDAELAARMQREELEAAGLADAEMAAALAREFD